MIRIGAKCKINLSETNYKIIDIRKKDIQIKLDAETTHQIIDYLVDLEEVDNPDVKVKNVSIFNVHLDDI